MKNDGKTLSAINSDINPLRKTAAAQARVNLTFRCSDPIGVDRKKAWIELESCNAENKRTPIATTVTESLDEKDAKYPLAIDIVAIKTKAAVINRSVRDPLNK